MKKTPKNILKTKMAQNNHIQLQTFLKAYRTGKSVQKGKTNKKSITNTSRNQKVTKNTFIRQNNQTVESFLNKSIEEDKFRLEKRYLKVIENIYDKKNVINQMVRTDGLYFVGSALRKIQSACSYLEFVGECIKIFKKAQGEEIQQFVKLMEDNNQISDDKEPQVLAERNKNQQAIKAIVLTQREKIAVKKSVQCAKQNLYSKPKENKRNPLTICDQFCERSSKEKAYIEQIKPKIPIQFSFQVKKLVDLTKIYPVKTLQSQKLQTPARAIFPTSSSIENSPQSKFAHLNQTVKNCIKISQCSYQISSNTPTSYAMTPHSRHTEEILNISDCILQKISDNLVILPQNEQKLYQRTFQRQGNTHKKAQLQRDHYNEERIELLAAKMQKCIQSNSERIQQNLFYSNLNK